MRQFTKNFVTLLLTTGMSTLAATSVCADSIFVENNGVGIGTDTPSSTLHVQNNTATQLKVKNTNVAGIDQMMFSLEAQGNDKIRFGLRGSGGSNTWTFDNTPALNKFSISKVGTGANEFSLSAAGDGFFQGSVTATGFLNSSSREFKTDIEALDAPLLLDRVMALPVLQWRYREEDESTQHIGPMAEDFQAAFGLGSNQHISLSDMGGITLAAVQEVYREQQKRNVVIDKLKAEVARLQRDNAELREGLANDNRALTERLAALEELLLKPENQVAQR